MSSRLAETRPSLTQVFFKFPAVNRGVATTSVASKKPAEETAANVHGAEDSDGPSGQAHADSREHTKATTGDGEGGTSKDVLIGGSIAPEHIKEDWEDEKAAEEVVLQALVERLHDKGEKEVARVLKAS